MMTGAQHAQRAKAMLGTLIGNFEDVLTEAGEREHLCSLTAYPGIGVVIDYGLETDGCGGMGWVRIVSVNPTVGYPNADVTLSNCGAYDFAYLVEIGIMRPSPEITEDAVNGVEIPTDAENFDAAMKQIDDIHWMHEAIVRTRPAYSDTLPGQWTPLGPEGGMVGGTWTVTMSGDPD
jgi:hypothetical protein